MTKRVINQNGGAQFDWSSVGKLAAEDAGQAAAFWESLVSIQGSAFRDGSDLDAQSAAKLPGFDDAGRLPL